jgi:hypothetical protein
VTAAAKAGHGGAGSSDDIAVRPAMDSQAPFCGRLGAQV